MLIINRRNLTLFFITTVRIVIYLLTLLKYTNSKQKILKFLGGNVSKDFSADDTKKTESYEYVYDFSVDFVSTDVTTDVANILDIHKVLMIKNNLK